MDDQIHAGAVHGAPTGPRTDRGADPPGHPPGTSRRAVLALLGAGALVPVTVTVLGGASGGATAVSEADGLRVEVLRASRRVLPAHTDHAEATSLFEATSWPDVVRVELLVRNLAGAALLVSPGQFRLRVAAGVSVMPTAWRHGPAALAAGADRTGWVDYRAPRTTGPLALEFTPAGRPGAVSVSLPAGTGVPA